MKQTPDHGEATIALLQATRAIVERDIGLGLITPERLRFTIEARKQVAKELADKGMSQREIAKAVGVDQKTVSNDLRKNSSNTEEKLLGEGPPEPETADEPEPERKDGYGKPMNEAWVWEKLRFIVNHGRHLPKERVIALLNKMMKEVLDKWDK